MAAKDVVRMQVSVESPAARICYLYFEKSGAGVNLVAVDKKQKYVRQSVCK
jgi:hypothetical protein